MKLINISGESREYHKNGFIYEFPFPAKSPTQVPKEIGERLLATKQFKEESDKKTNKDINKKEINEVE